jgi:hypothetical protein
MISNDLLQKLLVAFPKNAEEIKKHVQREEWAELRSLLLKISGIHPMPRFDEEIRALKEGRFSDIPSTEERKKRFSLAMEAVRVST